MAHLDNTWIWSEEEANCPPEPDGPPLKLGLTNIEGIFVLVVGGILIGTVLIVIEITYNRFHEGGSDSKKSTKSCPSSESEDNQEEQVQNNESNIVDDIPLSTRKMCMSRIDRYLPNSNSFIFNQGKMKMHMEDKGCNSYLCRDQMMVDILKRLEGSESLPPLLKTTSDSQWINYYLKLIDNRLIRMRSGEESDSIDSIDSLVESKIILCRMLKVALSEERLLSESLAFKNQKDLNNDENSIMTTSELNDSKLENTERSKLKETKTSKSVISNTNKNQSAANDKYYDSQNYIKKNDFGCKEELLPSTREEEKVKRKNLVRNVVGKKREKKLRRKYYSSPEGLPDVIHTGPSSAADEEEG